MAYQLASLKAPHWSSTTSVAAILYLSRLIDLRSVNIEAVLKTNSISHFEGLTVPRLLYI